MSLPENDSGLELFSFPGAARPGSTIWSLFHPDAIGMGSILLFEHDLWTKRFPFVRENRISFFGIML